MRKQEYIHVHTLFLEISHYLIDNEDMPTERLAAYNALDTSPWSVHASKHAHHEAVLALTTAICPWLKQARDESLDPPVA